MLCINLSRLSNIATETGMVGYNVGLLVQVLIFPTLQFISSFVMLSSLRVWQWSMAA